MKTKITTFILLLALLFLPTSNVYAQSPSGDVIRIGENFTLKSGETINGSLIVVGGNANIEEGASISRDVILIGGNLTIDGDIEGTVAIIGGNLTISGTTGKEIVVIGGQVLLTKTSVVNGDVVTVGGQVTKEDGAEVVGNIVNNTPLVDVPDVPVAPNVPNVPNVPNTPNFDISINPFWAAFKVVSLSLIMGALAALLTLFLDQQIKRVSNYVVSQPLIAGSVGLLSIFVSLLLILTIAPIFIIALAWFLGVISIGQEVGERFTKAINQIWATPLVTGFGTFILVLIGGFINITIPCFGWLFNFGVALIGIGAVIMTRFGTLATPVTIAPPVQAPPSA